VTIDTTTPAAPAISAITPDSGATGDHITNTPVLTLSGTAEANGTVTVFDGIDQLGTVTANGSGDWNFLTATLAPGDHTFTATATDAAGNISAASAAVAETIDTTAPAAPVISAITPDSGATGDHITNTPVLTLSGTAEANGTVTVFDGIDQLGTAPANSNGDWNFDTATLAQGDHTFTATATDAAGNISAASAAVAEAIDTTAPSIAIDSITGDNAHPTIWVLSARKCTDSSDLDLMRPSDVSLSAWSGRNE
jgi:hypothetical protein